MDGLRKRVRVVLVSRQSYILFCWVGDGPDLYQGLRWRFGLPGGLLLHAGPVRRRDYPRLHDVLYSLAADRSVSAVGSVLGQKRIRARVAWSRGAGSAGSVGGGLLDGRIGEHPLRFPLPLVGGVRGGSGAPDGSGCLFGGS